MVTAHSLRDLFDGFLLAKEADGVRPTTLDTYRRMYRNIVRDFPPEKLKNPKELTAQDFQEWVIGLRKRLATATVDQRIAKAKAFFNWCVREGFLETNPIGAIKRPKKNWQPDPLSEEEVTILLDSTLSWPKTLIRQGLTREVRITHLGGLPKKASVTGFAYFRTVVPAQMQKKGLSDSN